MLVSSVDQETSMHSSRVNALAAVWVERPLNKEASVIVDAFITFIRREARSFAGKLAAIRASLAR